ncbi:unnamed protein product [Linum trigynum]|uniref:Uncharacterized protein n=1 Tax=Linum trigynum TaxID=586398 RepID=A0AAV2DM37_9ROSI
MWRGSLWLAAEEQRGDWCWWRGTVWLTASREAGRGGDGGAAEQGARVGEGDCGVALVAVSSKVTVAAWEGERRWSPFANRSTGDCVAAWGWGRKDEVGVDGSMQRREGQLAIGVGEGRTKSKGGRREIRVWSLKV